MALGIMDSSEFDKELELLSKPLKEQVVFNREKNSGRTEGAIEVPQSIRKLAAAMSLDGIAAKNITEELGISQSSISAYKTGHNSTADIGVIGKENKELKSSVASAKERIVKRGLETITSAIDALTPDEIALAKPRDKAGIAKDVSAVIKNLTPETEDKPDITFNLFVPKMKTESDYEVVDAQVVEE